MHQLSPISLNHPDDSSAANAYLRVCCSQWHTTWTKIITSGQMGRDKKKILILGWGVPEKKWKKKGRCRVEKKGGGRGAQPQG